MSAPAARRDLTLLAAGQAVSVAGDAAALVALLLRIRPEGSGWVAALLAAELVPYVLMASVAGWVVDRFETRQVLLLALIGQAAVAVPLALVSAPWATVAFFAGLNALSTLVQPATAALVPAITGASDAARGYTRLATGGSFGWIVGPAVGGLVTGALGTTAAMLLDAASFAVLGGATALIRARRRPRPPPPTDDPASARGGFALLWHTPALRVALLVSAVATGCAVIDNVAAPFRFIDQLHTTDTGYGLYLTAWGVGAFLGVQILPRLRRHRHASALAAGNLVIGLGIAGIGLAPVFAVALIASAIGGLGNGLANVARSSLVATHTPAAQHGRAFAAASATAQTAIGVGTGVAAPLVSALGANVAMIAAGSLAALAAAAGLTRSIRSP